MTFILGIDSGLSVTKAALYDVEGRQVCVARREVEQIMPKPHHVERDMDTLWLKTAEAIKEALFLGGIDSKDISAISQTAHGDGLYLLDASLHPLGNGILSLDSRAQGEVDHWENNGTSNRSLQLTGQKPHASAPSAILAWIKTNEPERYKKIAYILTCKDWLRFCLTRQIATDRTESSTSFTNVNTQSYDHVVCDMFSLESINVCLPPILHSAEIAGKVTEDAAKATGLNAGTPVATGLHDVTASALGMDAHAPNCLAIIAGTYSINQVMSERPKISKDWFCRNAIEPNFWNNMAISPASTTNYDWFVKMFCAADMRETETHGQSIHQILAEEAMNATSASTLFHPFLFGSPFGAHASAGLMGLRGWHKRGDIIAAIFEGIVFNHRHHVDKLRKEFEVQTVRLNGGISRNPLVPQLFADTLGLPVEVSDVEEGAAWGAAICAGVSVGIFQSVTDGSRASQQKMTVYQPSSFQKCEALEQKYQNFKAAAEHMEPIWKQLNLETGRQT